MDPNQTLLELLQDLVRGDRLAAIESADALSTWMLKGGFAPTVKGYIVAFHDKVAKGGSFASGGTVAKARS